MTFSGQAGVFFPHGSSFQVNRMGIMDHAIDNGIGDGFKEAFSGPSIFLNLRLLNSTSFSATALLSSARLKKVWFLRAANIHISSIFTDVSTLALSFGFLTRVGIITVPWIATWI